MKTSSLSKLLMCGVLAVTATAGLRAQHVLAADINSSAPPAQENTTGPSYEMNGIRLKTYQGFEKNWKMVTVRFRTDIGEQRFVYANDIAYDVMNKGGKDYPDGAVFAKIGVMTEDDPEFTSSKVPAGARRVQFMVRDKKKYADTGGWGYALFSVAGQQLVASVPPQQQAEACDACHQIVQESRGEIFSKPMDLMAPQPFFPVAAHMSKSGADVFNHQQAVFENYDPAKLPDTVRRLLPANTVSVRFIDGTLRDHAFSGTLSELQPFLIEEASHTEHPAVFVSRDNRQYAVVVNAADKKDKLQPCPANMQPYLVYHSLGLDPKNLDAPVPAKAISTCVGP